MSDLEHRASALDMSPDEFRRAGHALVDQLAELWETVRERPLTQGDDPGRAWELVGRGPLPEHGTKPEVVLSEAFAALKQGSLFNGHPKFFGYITAGAAPIGVLSDLLAAGINPNCGGWPLSPVASAIELQTVRWIAELIGFPADCGGMLCSGGNVANMLGFWAARANATGAAKGQDLRAYAPAATHTWLQKAADLSGIGAENVVMVPCDEEERMDTKALRDAIVRDKKENKDPFLVVASGGTVSTGAVDDLEEVRRICVEHGLWMHVDGAYGAFAACLPENPENIQAIKLADSIALDPHKWLYAPLEAGCVLTKKRSHLLDAFSYRPPYYHFHREDSPEWCNFYELGIQNSRGFRALKVWAALRQAGRQGYVESIRQDIALAKAMAEHVKTVPELELRSHRLSIVTFRFVPLGGRPEFLDSLNERILTTMQSGGEAFVSNAVLSPLSTVHAANVAQSEHAYFLRACVVNFRTQLRDVLETVDLAAKLGREIYAEVGAPAP